jgi:hypothetical protein
MTQEQRTDTWLPMETAPKDGTRFIAWSNLNGYVPWVFWSDKTGVWMSEFIQWNGNPIAWMPFPDEPTWAYDESIVAEEADV